MPTNSPWASVPEDLPGFAAWAEEQDRRHSWGVLVKAAQRALAEGLYRCTCQGASCEACILDRVIAECDDPEAWHPDDIIELTDAEDVIDLAQLEAKAKDIPF